MKISGLFIYITVILMVFGITATASSSTTGGLIVDWFAGDGANLTNVPNTTVAANKITWDKAMQWDGGSTNLVAATARTNLELGTLATQNSNGVSISGGTVTGITDIALADGGTGASTAAQARINLGLAVQPYSFMIYRDASNIYAVNGSTGTIESTSNDISVVLQYAIDHSIVRKNIFIAGGIYIANSLINFTTPGIVLLGEGGGQFDTYGTVIYKNFDGTSLFYINTDDSVLYNLDIRTASGKTGDTVHYVNAQSSVFDNNVISYSNGKAIIIDGYSLDNGNNIQIRNSDFMYNQYSLIVVDYPDITIDGNAFYGTSTPSGEYNVGLNGNTSNVNIIDNYFDTGAVTLSTTSNCLSLGVGSYGVIVSRNYIDNCQTGILSRGSFHTFVGNRFHLFTQNAMVVESNYSTYTANTFTAAGQTQTYFADIVLQNHATNNTITSNTFKYYLNGAYHPDSAIKELDGAWVNNTVALANIISPGYPSKVIFTTGSGSRESLTN